MTSPAPRRSEEARGLVDARPVAARQNHSARSFTVRGQRNG
jgi:hypothetical protein